MTRAIAARLGPLVVASVVVMAPWLTDGRAQAAAQTSEDALLARIVAEPRHVPHYLDLAEYLFEHQRFDEAERALLGAQNLVSQEAIRVEYADRERLVPGRAMVLMVPHLEGLPDTVMDGPIPLLESPIVLPASMPEGASGGLAVVDASVAPDGTVSAARVAASVPRALGKIALEAVRAARFAPTGVPSQLSTRVQVFADPGTGGLRVTTIPGPRLLTGYVRAVRVLLDHDDLERAIVELEAAIEAVRRERTAPGTAVYRRASGAPVPTLEPAGRYGRAVKSAGALPDYPPAARSAGTGGVVGLDVVVDGRGHVARIDVRQGIDGLDEAVVEAVGKWLFVPGYLDGVPLAQVVPVSVVFMPETGEVTDRLRTGSTVPEPRKVYDVRPFYPADARLERIEGIVILDAHVASDGRVIDTEVLRSYHPLLDAAAVDAVTQWRYEPTLVDGVPVDVMVTVTLQFRLGR